MKIIKDNIIPISILALLIIAGFFGVYTIGGYNILDVGDDRYINVPDVTGEFTYNELFITPETATKFEAYLDVSADKLNMVVDDNGISVVSPDKSLHINWRVSLDGEVVYSSPISNFDVISKTLMPELFPEQNEYRINLYSVNREDLEIGTHEICTDLAIGNDGYKSNGYVDSGYGSSSSCFCCYRIDYLIRNYDWTLFDDYLLTGYYEPADIRASPYLSNYLSTACGEVYKRTWDAFFDPAYENEFLFNKTPSIELKYYKSCQEFEISGPKKTCFSCDGEIQLREDFYKCEDEWSEEPQVCETPLIDCYYCDQTTGIIDTQQFESCTGDWTTSVPSTCEAPIELIECYSCDGDLKVIDEFESCTGDWTTDSSLVCELPIVLINCYSCDDTGSTVTKKFESCEGDWDMVRPTSCTNLVEVNETVIECYSCSSDNLITGNFVSCIDEWSETKLNCEEQIEPSKLNWEYISYTTAFILLVGIIFFFRKK